MKLRAYIILAFVLLSTAPVVAYQKGARHFGAPFTDAKLVALADAMAKVEDYSGKPIKVEGKIEDVCTNKGCWLVVTDGEQAMRVTFKDYGFFVPKDSAGKKVVLEGIIERKTISEDHARHYAEESKSKKVDPASIKGPQQVVTMVATGVSIQD